MPPCPPSSGIQAHQNQFGKLLWTLLPEPQGRLQPVDRLQSKTITANPGTKQHLLCAAWHAATPSLQLHAYLPAQAVAGTLAG